MQTATAPGASSRTFLIHMFRRGLDDNRYVVERYKSTFDGEIVRWSGKGKSKTGKQPRQVMSLGAVQRMRPERDEIIVCTGVMVTRAIMSLRPPSGLTQPMRRQNSFDSAWRFNAGGPAMSVRSSAISLAVKSRP